MVNDILITAMLGILLFLALFSAIVINCDFLDDEGALKFIFTVLIIVGTIFLLIPVVNEITPSSTDNNGATEETKIHRINKEDTDTQADNNVTEIDLGDRKILIIVEKQSK